MGLGIFRDKFHEGLSTWQEKKIYFHPVVLMLNTECLLDGASQELPDVFPVTGGDLV